MENNLIYEIRIKRSFCYQQKSTAIKNKPLKYNMPREGGAVLMEFVVIVGLVLAPLFIGVTLIGKYTDNAQKVEVAARYSAWERTAWYQELPSSLQEANSNIDTEKSAEEIGFELQNRVFSNKNSAIYLAQKTDSITEEVDPMSESFWVDDTLHFIEIKITCRVPYLSVF